MTSMKAGRPAIITNAKEIWTKIRFLMASKRRTYFVSINLCMYIKAVMWMFKQVDASATLVTPESTRELPAYLSWAPSPQSSSPGVRGAPTTLIPQGSNVTVYSNIHMPCN